MTKGAKATKPKGPMRRAVDKARDSQRLLCQTNARRILGKRMKARMVAIREELTLIIADPGRIGAEEKLAMAKIESEVIRAGVNALRAEKLKVDECWLKLAEKEMEEDVAALDQVKPTEEEEEDDETSDDSSDE